MPPTSPPMLSADQRLGGYAIVELVGRGGMGEVYRARQLSMDREVALKVLSPRLVRQDPAFAEKFVAEARAAGRLNHPNIVAVHDVATAPAPEGCQDMVAGETVNFFSMEFISGETVRDVIDRQGAIDLDLVARVMTGMAEALVFAEANGIVHRDIKPDNIMLPTLGGVKLADLGLALQVGEVDAVAGKDEQGRSKVMGTPLYIAPEQAQAKTVDHRADQYALGATLFHMLTGRPPYTGDSSRTIMRAHCFDPIPDPAVINPQVPPPWRDLCLRLLAKDPADRFATGAALRSAVKATVRWRPGPSQRTRAQRRQSSWIGLAAISVIAIVVLWLVFGLTQRQPPPVPVGTGPTPAKPSHPAAPVDPAAIARERAAVQLAHLPSDPTAALVAVEALLANPSLTLARPELEKRRNEILATLHEQRRAVQAGKLDAIEQDLASGRLAEAREALNEIPEDARLRERRDALSLRLRAAERVSEGRLASAIAAAANTAACDRLAPDIEAAGLPDQLRNGLRNRLSARRAAIATASVKPVLDPGPAWRQLASRVDQLRGTWPYAAFGEACLEEMRGFPESDRELVRSLAEISDLVQRAESALRTYIAERKPTVECRFAAKTGTFMLTQLEKDVIFFRLADGPVGSRISRATAEPPWRQLLQAALENGKGEPRCEAAFLWYWRSPEAAAAIERIAQDPLGHALATYKRRAGLVDAVGAISRRDDAVTITYDFAPKGEAKLLGDWIGVGLSLSERGMRWQTDKVVGGKDTTEGNLPSVRWKTSLKPPCSLDLTCLPETDIAFAQMLVGLSAGNRAVRVGIHPKRRRADIFITKEGTDQYEVLGQPLLDLSLDTPPRIQLELAVDGTVTAKVNGKAMVTEKPLMLPANEAASIVFQIRLPKDKASLTIQTLAVSGKP